MKWSDKEDVIRLETEEFEDDNYMDEELFKTVSIELKQGERLIGFRSR